MRCRGDSGDAVTAFGTYPLTMQRNASLFFAEIPDDIGQLAANPDLGQMLIHEESPAFGIANDDTQHVERIFSAFNIICVRFACIFSTIIPSHTLMDAALLQTLLQAFVHREKVQTVDAALEQDIQLMLQIFFGKIS